MMIQRILIELERAERGLRTMEAARNYVELEGAWSASLHHLDRAWERSNGLRGEPWFVGWRSHFHSARRSDPLLRYLEHARNSDHHTLFDTVEKRDGKLEITAQGGSMIIQGISIVDGVLTIRKTGDASPVVRVFPSSTVLLPANNKGEIVHVPTEHLGKPLIELTPVVAIRLGLAWHKNFIEKLRTEIEKRAKQVTRSNDHA